MSPIRKWAKDMNRHFRIYRGKIAHEICVNTRTQDPEQYWWAYLRGWNGDTEVENGSVDTVGKGEAGTTGESSGPSTHSGWDQVRWGAAAPGAPAHTQGESRAGEELPLHQDPQHTPGVRAGQVRSRCTGSLSGPREAWRVGRRGRSGRRREHSRGWLALLCGRNQHKVVKKF